MRTKEESIQIGARPGSLDKVSEHRFWHSGSSALIFFIPPIPPTEHTLRERLTASIQSANWDKTANEDKEEYGTLWVHKSHYLWDPVRPWPWPSHPHWTTWDWTELWPTPHNLEVFLNPLFPASLQNTIQGRSPLWIVWTPLSLHQNILGILQGSWTPYPLLQWPWRPSWLLVTINKTIHTLRYFKVFKVQLAKKASCCFWSTSKCFNTTHFGHFGPLVAHFLWLYALCQKSQVFEGSVLWIYPLQILRKLEMTFWNLNLWPWPTFSRAHVGLYSILCCQITFPYVTTNCLPKGCQFLVTPTLASIHSHAGA